jgi:hypothetical protein
VSPVKYELGVYNPEDGILRSHQCENLKSCNIFIRFCIVLIIGDGCGSADVALHGTSRRGPLVAKLLPIWLPVVTVVLVIMFDNQVHCLQLGVGLN